MEDTNNMGGRKGLEVGEVGAAAGFDGAGVGVHNHVFGVGLFEDGGAATGVVGVSVADEENLDVGWVKAELLDAVEDERRRRDQVGVDEDVAGWRGDEVGS